MADSESSQPILSPPNEAPIYCLVQGSWHVPEHMGLLAQALQEQGCETKTVELPMDNPDATFNDYKDRVCKIIDDERNTRVVLHSRMGNIGPLIASELDVPQIVYLCAGFERDYADYFKGTEKFYRRLPNKYSSDFLEGIILDEYDERLTCYDPEKAIEVLYNDCDPSTAEWAASLLRPHYRPAGVPEINGWRNVNSLFITGDIDQVYNPKYSRYVARYWLGAKAIELSGGHSLFLSQPRKLSRALLQNAVSL